MIILIIKLLHRGPAHGGMYRSVFDRSGTTHWTTYLKSNPGSTEELRSKKAVRKGMSTKILFV